MAKKGKSASVPPEQGNSKLKRELDLVLAIESDPILQAIYAERIELFDLRRNAVAAERAQIRIENNGGDESRLPTEERLWSIEYNFANEIDWAEVCDFHTLKPRDAILLIHGLNPRAYKGGVPPRLKQNEEALDFFSQVKHWLDVVGSETADSKTAAEWLAWADKRQLPVHSEFRAMVATKTAPTEAIMDKRDPQPKPQVENAAPIDPRKAAAAVRGERESKMQAPSLADVGVGERAVQAARALAESQKATRELKPITDTACAEWLNAGLWKLHQAVCLCVGIEALHDDIYELRYPRDWESCISDANIRLKWRTLCEASMNAMDLWDQDAMDSEGLQYLPPRETKLYLRRRVKPAEYAAWASKRGFQLPKPIMTLALNESATDNRPSTTGRPKGELHDAQQNAVAAEHAQIADISPTEPVPESKTAITPAPTESIKPVPRLTAQNAAILEEIRRLRLDPLALPKAPAGKPGVKADIRATLCASLKKVFQSKGVFDDAWQRLRDQKQISDRTD